LPGEAGTAAGCVEHDACRHLVSAGEMQAKAAGRQRVGSDDSGRCGSRSRGLRGLPQQRVKAAAVEMPAMAEAVEDEIASPGFSAVPGPPASDRGKVAFGRDR